MKKAVLCSLLLSLASCSTGSRPVRKVCPFGLIVVEPESRTPVGCLEPDWINEDGYVFNWHSLPGRQK